TVLSGPENGLSLGLRTGAYVHGDGGHQGGDRCRSVLVSHNAAWRPQPSRGDPAAPFRLGPTGHLSLVDGRAHDRISVGVRGSRRLTLSAAITARMEPRAFHQIRPGEGSDVFLDRRFEAAPARWQRMAGRVTHFSC